MFIYVPLELVLDNPFQARQEYGDIAELAERIRVQLPAHPETRGLLQVPTGRLVDADGKPAPIARYVVTDVQNMMASSGYRVQLAFGHRRRRAFEALRASGDNDYAAGVMPVRLVDLDDEAMLDAVWQENHGRRDISAVEEAALLSVKLQRPTAGGGSRSQRDVAEEWGLARSTIANRLRLLDAPEVVQEANRAGRLSERQCLALMAVQQLAESVNGDVDWGSDPDLRKRQQWSYETPSPAAVVEWVATTEEGSEVTSDVLREYVGKALKLAGTPLPQLIAAHEVAPLLKGMRQESCRGCPKRMNDTCLDESCLSAKKAHYGEGVAQAAAEECGVAYTDDPARFKDQRAYAARRELKKLWEAGGRCEHMVIGWSDRGDANRPFSSYSHLSYDDAYNTDHPRRGVILGHEGDILPACWPVKEDADIEPPHPLVAGKAAWTSTAEAQKEAAEAKTKEVLSAALMESWDLSSVAAMLRLLQGKYFEKSLTNERLAQAFVEHGWARGNYMNWSNDSPRKRLDACQVLLDEAGLDGCEILAEEFGAQATAVRLLAEWAEARERSWRKEEVTSELQPLVAGTLQRLNSLKEEAPVVRLNDIMDLYEPLVMVYDEIALYLSARDKGKDEEEE